MNSFNIEVNLGNIYEAIAYVTERINFLQHEKNGYPRMMYLLANDNSRLTITNQWIKLLSAKYAEVATSIVTRNESLIQNTGDLVNQQKSVIEESNRYLQKLEAHLQGIENKLDPPAIPDIQALMPKQSEMRIDEVTEFMTK